MKNKISTKKSAFAR